MAIIKIIWKYRNNVIFRNVVIDGEEIFAQTQLKDWP